MTASRSVRRRALSLAFLVAVGYAARSGAQQAAGPGVEEARVRLALADSDYNAGNRERAEREYRAVLQADPKRSRAVYQLAQLTVDRDESVQLLRQYAALEPRDPWGFMALGDALAARGDLDQGLAAYDAAARLAPGERDVHIGRARLLARALHTDDAISVYERWTAAHPTDAEAWRELASQRGRAGRLRGAIAALERAQSLDRHAKTAHRLAYLRAIVAPLVQLGVAGSEDSDKNHTLRLEAAADAQPSDGLSAGIVSSTTHVGDGTTTGLVSEGALAIRWRPLAALRLETLGGFSIPASQTPNASGAIPSGSLRLNWRPPGNGSSIDVRVSRSLVAASPLLVLNRVVRNEVAGRADLEVTGPFRIRGIGRFSDITSSIDDNRRALLGGGLVAASPLGELAATVQQLAYAHPTTSGYFAPRSARIAELGLYSEYESEGGVRLALDVAGGAQSVTNWGLTASPWTPAYRAWGELALPLAPGRELRLEVEGYDARIGSDVATSATWSFGSARLSLHWALY